MSFHAEAPVTLEAEVKRLRSTQPHLTEAQARRCERSQATTPPNATAWCRNDSEAFDAYVNVRRSWQWGIARLLYAFGTVAFLVTFRQELFKAAKWVVYDQIITTCCFICSDFVTRPSHIFKGVTWREGQPHPYASSVPGLASFVYATLGIIGAFGVSLCRWTAFTGEQVKGHTRLSLPATAHGRTDCRTAWGIPPHRRGPSCAAVRVRNGLRHRAREAS